MIRRTYLVCLAGLIITSTLGAFNNLTAAQEPTPYPPDRHLDPDPQPFGSPFPGGPQQDEDGIWFIPGTDDRWELSIQSPRGTGGPDEFGYTWDDGIAFSWIDAAGGAGTGLNGDGSGQAAGPITLPFPFKYYENTYSEVWIAASGYLSFEEADYWDSQSPLPDSSQPNNVIAPYWTPTYIGAGSWIRYLSGGLTPNRYFVVEWHDLAGGSPEDEIGSDELYRFEVILHENGDIVFQFQNMTNSGSTWCGVSGIEDSTGEDGLSYTDFCAMPPSNQGVRFFRPPPSARLRINPAESGSFTQANKTHVIPFNIRNNGDLGPDTYDITLASPWATGLFEMDGFTPLVDHDSDGIIDTGTLAPGESKTVVLRAHTPSLVNVGDSNTAAMTATSSINLAVSKSAVFRSVVPAPFAQGFQDLSDRAIRIFLASPENQSVLKVTDDFYYGNDLALVETPGFVYAWNHGECLGPSCDIFVSEIEYTLLESDGDSVLGIRTLAQNDGASTDTYDLSPAVAVLPDGHIGILWYRYKWDGSTSQRNYNIFFAILDDAGNTLLGPTNLTNNNLWGGWNDLNLPTFLWPHIAATEDNRFILTWLRQHMGVGGLVSDIYYAVRDTNGGVLKAITQLTNDTEGNDDAYYGPSVTRLSSNRALLVYQRAGDYGDIYYAVLNSAGNISLPMTNLSGDGPAIWDWGWPDATQLSGGRIVVAWTISEPNSDTALRYAVLDPNYNLLSGPTILSHPSAAGGDNYVSLAADTANHAVFTWTDSGWENRRQLYYALLDDNGNVLTDPFTFLESQEMDNFFPGLETGTTGYGNTTYTIAPTTLSVDTEIVAPGVVGGQPNGIASIPIHFHNNGETTATSVTITTTLGVSLTYGSDNAGVTPTVNGNSLSWTFADLDFLGQGAFTLQVTLPDSPVGTRIPVSLAIFSAEPDAIPGDNQIVVDVMIAVSNYLPAIVR